MTENKNKESTIIVIFGITGDLSRNKLIPALLDLEVAGCLNERVRVIGFSRRDFSGVDFESFVRDVIVAQKKKYNAKQIEQFLKKFSYCPAHFEDPASYARLGQMIIQLEKEVFHACANKLYYLATPPAFYETIFRELADSGLTIPCGGANGWARVLVEKPFGHDIETAEKLDTLLGKLFKEEQIFRIDHYLAKEAIQNIHAFRFSNALFEPVWNSKYIEKVEIKLWEAKEITGRGAYYDNIGALRDVGQNHLLQMLSSIAMEPPKGFGSEELRTARAHVLASLKLDTDKHTVQRAQYEGYRSEQGVDDMSETETYFRIVAHIANDRWSGVPFILESGKALSEAKTEIILYFKRAEHCLCTDKKVCVHHNRLTFRIQPDENISISFWIKKPGFERMLEEKTLHFSYGVADGDPRLPDAYEKLLFDALQGDQMLFAGTKEVLAGWKFVTSVFHVWKKDALISYKKGSKPKAPA